MLPSTPPLRKALYHFYPGGLMLSVGSVGCNFRCPGCGETVIQRSHLSRPRVLLAEGRCPHCGTEVAGRFRRD